MSDYLTHLARKALGREPVLQPRLPGLFEPSDVGGMMGEAAPRSEGLTEAEPPARTAAARAASPLRPGEVALPATPASRPHPASIRLPRGEEWAREASPAPASSNRPTPAVEATAAIPEVPGHLSWPHRPHDGRSRLEPLSKPAAESARPDPPKARSAEHSTHRPPPARAVVSASTPVDRLSVHGTPRVERLRPSRPEVSAPPARATAAPPSAVPAPPPVRSVPRAARIPASPPAAPPIRVSIGRVEVRLVAPPAPPSPSPPSQPKPAMSLDEYLRRRHGGRA